jgi:hypothetical protein
VISNSKNKDFDQQCTFQKVWKILLFLKWKIFSNFVAFSEYLIKHKNIFLWHIEVISSSYILSNLVDLMENFQIPYFTGLDRQHLVWTSYRNFKNACWLLSGNLSNLFHLLSFFRIITFLDSKYCLHVKKVFAFVWFSSKRVCDNLKGWVTPLPKYLVFWQIWSKTLHGLI